MTNFNSLFETKRLENITMKEPDKYNNIFALDEEVGTKSPGFELHEIDFKD
jgi:hypothetical protein